MNSPGPNTPSERRSDRRSKVYYRLHWSRGEAEEFEGAVWDLSIGGCFVESREGVREGDLVKLRLDIPEGGELVIWGNVVFWIKDMGFGLRFSALSQGGVKEKLEKLLLAM